jgi:hypothetical protein
MIPNLSQLLHSAKNGDWQARADLVHRAYDDLRSLAKAGMANQGPGHALTTTALVNKIGFADVALNLAHGRRNVLFVLDFSYQLFQHVFQRNLPDVFSHLLHNRPMDSPVSSTQGNAKDCTTAMPRRTTRFARRAFRSA